MTKRHRVPAHDLGTRTPGEKLWLARKTAKLTQVQAAALAGIGENAYGEAERDQNAAVRGPVAGIPGVSRPTLPQLLALARRRSGLDLGEAAAAAGWSRVWFLAKERAGAAGLKLHWEKRGFSFPK